MIIHSVFFGLLQQQKKRKLEALNSTEPTNSNVDAYNFDECDDPPPNVTPSSQSDRSESQVHSSVSVNINVHQINNQADPQGNQIKLTVSSTVQTGLGNPNNNPPGNQGLGHASSNVQTNANICKQEPLDDLQCPGSSNSSHNSFNDPIGLEDVDEIKAILDTLEKEEGEIPPDLIKDLDLGFKELEESGSLAQEKDHDLAHPMFNSGSSTKGSPGPTMFADPLYDSLPVSVNQQSLSNMGGQGAAAMANYHRPPTGGGAAPPPPILPVGDTGPAAETLKQMAAQHQSQESAGYNMKGPMPSYNQEYQDYRRTMPPHGYPHYPTQNFNPMSGTAQANMYPYNQQVPNHMNGQHGHMAVQPGAMGAKDPSLSYGGTKPLTHYPGQMGQSGPSSLQQLQNQVQSHFSQGQTPATQNGGPPNHLQVTQSQHLQMSHGSQRMQLTQSQSQQMQVHGTPQISVAQQQSFSMSPGMAPQQGGQYHMNEQMKMQMIRREQQGGHMQSYMNRPPPEYKVRPSGVNNNFPPNTMGANPLQTMQNMVNQTNQPELQARAAQNGMYHTGPMKAEMPGQQGAMPPQNIAGSVPANRGSPLLVPNANSVGQNGQTNMRNYGQQAPGQMMQGQTMGTMPVANGTGPNQPMDRGQQAPGQMMQGQTMGTMPVANGTGPNQPMKPPTPTYTSAIMRNQRPPNVNVGPEGLNISQQRSHSGEWPRTMTPGSTGPGQGSPQQMGRIVRPNMANSSMMQYAGYQGPPGAMSQMNPGAQDVRMQMTQQQAAMHARQRTLQTSMGNSGMHPNMASSQGNSSMMMQQQQGAQVSHNMASMSMSQSMSTTATTSQQQSHPQQPQQPPQQQSHPQQPHPTQQPPPQQQQQQTAQNSHGFPQQGSTQNASSDFHLEFLENTQGTESQDFFDSMVQNGQSDLYDEIFGK